MDKNIIILLLLAATIYLGKEVYLNRYGETRIYKKYSELLGTVKEASKIEKGLIELRTEYLDKAKLLKEVEKKYNSTVVKYNQVVKSTVELTAKIKGGYFNQVALIEGEDSPEVCIVKPEGLYLYPFSIKSDLVFKKNSKTGEEAVIASSYYILDKEAESSWAGIPYRLSFTEGILRTDPTSSAENKRERLLVYPGGLNLGVNTTGSLSLSTTLLGLGKDRLDISMKFLNLGLAYSQDLGLDIGIGLTAFRLYPNLFRSSFLGLDYQYKAGWGIGFITEL